MNAFVIDMLLAGVGRYGDRPPLSEQPATWTEDPAIERFVMAYKCPDIGWSVLQDYIHEKRVLPIGLLGDDQWLLRALLCARGKVRDLAVLKAVAIGTDRRFRRDAELFKALLLVEGVTAGDVAEHLNVERDIVACFEKLFFNVLDRRLDNLYLRHIVYPDGRLVEMFDAYLRNEPLGRLLLRAGFNNGAEDVMFLAGANRVDMVKAIASGDNVARKLEALFMANGYVVARNGGLNQSDARGLLDAKALIAAAKQGGQEQDDENPVMSVGASLYNEMRVVAKLTRENQADARIAAAQNAEMLIEV